MWDSGVVVVVASGKKKVDNCETNFCRNERAICVGAHEYDIKTCVKKVDQYASYGPCVDIMAPGEDILTAESTNNIGK